MTTPGRRGLRFGSPSRPTAPRAGDGPESSAVRTAETRQPGAAGESLVFMHIIKTAGTALRQALATHYEPDEIAPQQFLEEMEAVGAEPVRDRYRLMMVHFGYGLATALAPNMVTVLRDPVERIVSIYNFWRGVPLPETGPVDRALRYARELSFSDFIRLEDDRIADDIRDSQTMSLVLGNDRWSRKRLEGIDRRDLLRIAERNLKSFDVTGTTERMGAFATEFELRFGIRLEIGRANETPQRFVSTAEISAADLAYLREITALDRHLHERLASGELDPDPGLIEARRRAFLHPIRPQTARIVPQPRRDPSD
ncbi:MAG: hypothetical protein AAF416_20290 [Pseudomonadota bacterium]